MYLTAYPVRTQACSVADGVLEDRCSRGDGGQCAAVLWLRELGVLKLAVAALASAVLELLVLLVHPGGSIRRG